MLQSLFRILIRLPHALRVLAMTGCVIAVPLMTGPLQAAEDPLACEEAHNPVRDELSEHLFRIEYHLIQMNWFDWKYRQTNYEDVWDAKVQANDPFSPQERAEGEVRYSRYFHFAEAAGKTAESERDDMLSRIQQIPMDLETLEGSCEALKYIDCTKVWKREFLEAFWVLKKRMHEYVQEQVRARAQVDSTLKDLPSEHHDFGERYHELHVRWISDYHPEILRALQDLHERIDYDWPAENCCAFCTAEEVESATSSLYQYVKPDPEGFLGVDGGALAKADIEAAFDEMENREEDWEPEES